MTLCRLLLLLLPVLVAAGGLQLPGGGAGGPRPRQEVHQLAGEAAGGQCDAECDKCDAVLSPCDTECNKCNNIRVTGALAAAGANRGHAAARPARAGGQVSAELSLVI